MTCRLLYSGSTTTAKYQRPVQWDGRGFVLDQDRLDQCMAAPENHADSSVHNYDVETVTHMHHSMGASLVTSG